MLTPYQGKIIDARELEDDSAKTIIKVKNLDDTSQKISYTLYNILLTVPTESLINQQVGIVHDNFNLEVKKIFLQPHGEVYKYVKELIDQYYNVSLDGISKPLSDNEKLQRLSIKLKQPHFREKVVYIYENIPAFIKQYFHLDPKTDNEVITPTCYQKIIFLDTVSIALNIYTHSKDELSAKQYVEKQYTEYVNLATPTQKVYPWEIFKQVLNELQEEYKIYLAGGEGTELKNFRRIHKSLHPEVLDAISFTKKLKPYYSTSDIGVIMCAYYIQDIWKLYSRESGYYKRLVAMYDELNHAIDGGGGIGEYPGDFTIVSYVTRLDFDEVMLFNGDQGLHQIIEKYINIASMSASESQLQEVITSISKPGEKDHELRQNRLFVCIHMLKEIFENIGYFTQPNHKNTEHNSHEATNQ